MAGAFKFKTEESGTKPEESSDWPPPQPIAPQLLPVDPLRPEMLPEALEPWIMNIAHRMQCPPDFPATTAIVLISAIIGAGCGIRPKARDDWTVTPNLWGGIIARPGMFKSPAIGQGLMPLKRLEANAKKTFDAAMIEFAPRLMRFEARRKALKEAMVNEERSKRKSNDNKKENPETNLEEELTIIEAPEPPVWKRYRTNDATIEKIAELLAQNPRGILIERDELIGQLSTWDREGHESDRAFHLEGWNGTSSYTTDRIGRGTIYVPRLCESFFGGIQPSKLLAYLHDAVSNINNDGMIQRFQALVYPDEPENYNVVDEWPDNEAKNRAFAIIEKLASVDFLDYGAQLEDESNPPYFRFAPDAQAFFNNWLAALQAKLFEKDETPIITEHLAKFRSLIPSLALIFCLVEIADGEIADIVGRGLVALRHTEMAAHWCNYLETHARRIYGLVNNVSLNAAAFLGDKIKEGALKDGFTARDVYRKHWSALDSKELLEAALDGLLEAQWLREESSKQHPDGGRPTLFYRINPRLRESA